MSTRFSRAIADSTLQRRVAVLIVLWAISEPLLLSTPAVTDGSGSRWVALGFSLCVTTPLLWLERAPIRVGVFVLLAYLVQYTLEELMQVSMASDLALAFALFGVAAAGQASAARTGFALALAAAAPALLWLASSVDFGVTETVYQTQYVYLAAVAFCGVLPGLALQSRRREVDALERDVQELVEQAANEISVALDGERRSLSQALVGVVDELVGEIQRLVAEARASVGGADASAVSFGRAMAEAAGRAGDELRMLLRTLTAQPNGQDASSGAARRQPRRVTGDELRAWAGLAFPVVLLAALAVLDRSQLPPLPVALPTVDGGTLEVEASSLSPALGYALAVITPAGLLLRRRAPLAALVLVAALVVLGALLGEVSSLTIWQIFVCGALAYNAGAWPRKNAAAVAGLALALLTTLTLWRLEQYRFEAPVYGYMVCVLLGAWAVGRGVRHDLREALTLRGRAVVLRGQRDRLCEVAVSGQRRDVAREMHDVVGHGLSLIAVQSGVVEVLAPRDPARAIDALDQVEEATRTTRSELNALRLALGAPGAAGAPQSCLAALERIVREARAVGQPVLSYVDPRVDELDAGQRTAIVRITQEALTNARKHAGTAATTMEVAVNAQRVSVTVRNETGAALAGAPKGSGFGLTAMAERAAAHGGTVDAGPDGDGGWTVRAELPRELSVGRPRVAAPIR